jgi:hypothetical protein
MDEPAQLVRPNEKEIVMLRRSLLSTTTSVLLLLAPATAAWAGAHNAAPLHTTTTSGIPGFAPSNAYNISTALSTALSVGGTTGAPTINTSKKPPVVEFNSAPTVQTAVGAAVSIGGNASAAAINTNGVSQLGQH